VRAASFALLSPSKQGNSGISDSFQLVTGRAKEMVLRLVSGGGNMRSATVLVVDDDALILKVLVDELTEVGFEVMAARDGNQAIAGLTKDASRFKAIITDVNLGIGPDGWDVGRRARELVSNMPVVYLSGDSSHEWSSKGVPDSVMIAKPFVPVQLVTAISILITAADTHGSG